MNRIKLVLLFLGISVSVFGQIVNIEDKRAGIKDTIGWFERLDLGYNIINNGNKISTLSSTVQIEFLYKRKSLLSITKYNFLKAGEQSFVNEGFQHLRYNSRFSKKMTFEVFGQIQYNEKTKIKLRALAGTGLRIKLVNNKAGRFYYGVSYMYEYDDVVGEVKIHRENRMNNYISVKWNINKQSKLFNTTYYQPRFDDFSDFRLSSETSMVFKLTSHLSFKSSFFITHDSQSPDGVIATIYKFTNGLRYKFNE